MRVNLKLKNKYMPTLIMNKYIFSSSKIYLENIVCHLIFPKNKFEHNYSLVEYGSGGISFNILI